MIRVPTGSCTNETLHRNAMPHRANDPRLRLSQQLPGFKSVDSWTLGGVGLFVILVFVVGLMTIRLLEQNHTTRRRA